jgi:hypothetical protein
VDHVVGEYQTLSNAFCHQFNEFCNKKATYLQLSDINDAAAAFQDLDTCILQLSHGSCIRGDIPWLLALLKVEFHMAAGEYQVAINLLDMQEASLESERLFGTCKLKMH